MSLPRSKTLDQIIQQKAKPKTSKKIGGIIFSLFWDIAITLVGGQAKKFSDLVAEYFASPKSNVAPDKASQFSARNNLIHELIRGEMTFKVFVKGLRIFRIKSFKLTVELTHQNSQITIHSVDVPLMSEEKNEQVEE